MGGVMQEIVDLGHCDGQIQDELKQLLKDTK